MQFAGHELEVSALSRLDGRGVDENVRAVDPGVRPAGPAGGEGQPGRAEHLALRKRQPAGARIEGVEAQYRRPAADEILAADAGPSRAELEPLPGHGRADPAGVLDEGADAVPTELADAISLAGPVGRITERLELWRKSPATTLLVTGARDEPTLRAIRDALAAGG